MFIQIIKHLYEFRTIHLFLRNVLKLTFLVNVSNYLFLSKKTYKILVFF